MSNGTPYTYAICDIADIDALSSSNKADLLADLAQSAWGHERASFDSSGDVVVKWRKENPNPLDAQGVTHTSGDVEWIRNFIKANQAKWMEEVE